MIIKKNLRRDLFWVLNQDFSSINVSPNIQEWRQMPQRYTLSPLGESSGGPLMNSIPSKLWFYKYWRKQLLIPLTKDCKTDFTEDTVAKVFCPGLVRASSTLKSSGGRYLSPRSKLDLSGTHMTKNKHQEGKDFSRTIQWNSGLRQSHVVREQGRRFH